MHLPVKKRRIKGPSFPRQREMVAVIWPQVDGVIMWGKREGEEVPGSIT
jgi:hypothetical protein